MRLVLLTLSFVISTFATSALATTDEESVALCEAELTGPLGASRVGDMKVHRTEDGRPWVYGNADFADVARVHFRCKVYDNAVRHVSYLVRDPESASGRGWSIARPTAAQHDESLELDEAATAAPEAPLAEPKFESVD